MKQKTLKPTILDIPSLTLSLVWRILDKIGTMSQQDHNTLLDRLNLVLTIEELKCYILGCKEPTEANVLELVEIYSATDDISSFQQTTPASDIVQGTIREMRIWGGKFIKAKVRPDGQLPKEIYFRLLELTSNYGKWEGLTTVSYNKKSKLGKINDRAKDVDESIEVAIAQSELREALIDFATQADRSSNAGSMTFMILSFLFSRLNSLPHEACNQENALIFEAFLKQYNPGSLIIDGWRIEYEQVATEDYQPVEGAGNCFYDALIKGLGGHDSNGNPITVENLRMMVQAGIVAGIEDQERVAMIETQLLTYIITEDYNGLDLELAKFMQHMSFYVRNLERSDDEEVSVTQIILTQIREFNLVGRYLQTIGDGGNWADGIEIGVLANLLNINIVINNTNTGLRTQVGNGNHTIHLDYTGDHYIAAENILVEEQASPDTEHLVSIYDLAGDIPKQDQDQL